MNKQTLSELFIIEDFLPKEANVKNSELNSFILNDLATSSFEPLDKNRYGDLNLKFRKEYNWIFDYVVGQIYVKNNKMQLRYEGVSANVEGLGQSSFSRHNVNTEDVFNSPDLTVLYCVNGEGELVIEYPENIYKEKFITLDTEPGKIIIFNSGLKYYFLKNNFKDLRTTLAYKAKIINHY